MTLYRTFQLLNARIEARDGSSSTAVAMTAATITLDSTWSPYCQVDATLTELTQAQLTACDPRTGKRLRFTLRQIDGGTIVDRAFDLSLRRRTFDWVSRLVTVAAASDESLLQDWADGSPYNSGSSSTNYYAGYLVQAAIGRVLPNTVAFEAGYPDSSIAPADQVWEAGTTAWDYCSQQAEAAGARLYCDELGVFHWATPTWVADGTARSTDEPIEASDVVDREDPNWATYAVVAYTGNSPTQYVTSDAGTTPRKAITLQRARRQPAGNAATKIRTAAGKRGRTMSLKVPAQVVARPLQPWTSAFMSTSRSGIVQSVAIDVGAGLMTMLLNVVE